jgi:hypothetical protein
MAVHPGGRHRGRRRAVLYSLCHQTFEPLKTQAAEQAARNAVTTWATSSRAPSPGGRGPGDDLPALHRALVAERAVIAYDVCSYIHDMLGFPDRIARVARRQFAGSHVHKLDAQVYYSVNLA